MSDADRDRVLTNLRKRRRVVRGSITRLGNRLRATPDEPGVGDRAGQLATNLEALDKDLKSLHFDIIDCIDIGHRGNSGA